MLGLPKISDYFSASSVCCTLEFERKTCGIYKLSLRFINFLLPGDCGKVEKTLCDSLVHQQVDSTCYEKIKLFKVDGIRRF